MLLIGGHSGAGKSTLLKLIAGVETATRAPYWLAARISAVLPAPALPYYRRRIGMVSGSEAAVRPQCL
jgi:cell division transport system ATP-binding protein